MKNPLLAITLVATLAPTLATAQMVNNLDEKQSICPNRPSEPEIIANMSFRDADKVILLKRMYGAASLESIIETGDCSCETRFPDWDSVIEYYLEHYSSLDDRWKISDATKPYGRSITQNRPEAREICIAQGNWG